MGLVDKLSQGYNKWGLVIPTDVICFSHEDISGNAQGNRFDKNFVPSRYTILDAT